MKSTTVLLVEDNPGDADLIRAYLEETTGGTGELLHVPRIGDAVDALVSREVDVMLLDLSLPVEIQRGLKFLKTCGTQPEKDIREYLIDNSGMHIKEAFRDVNGILSGIPTYYTYEKERERRDNLFGLQRDITGLARIGW